MSELRRLCQTLHNGTPQSPDLQAAADLLSVALADAAEPAEAPFGNAWDTPDLPRPECPAQRRRVLEALAPMRLLDGIWLARAAWPATGHRETECHLLALYCRSVGLDDPARSPPLRFRAGLVAAGAYLPPVESPSFFAEPRVPDAALRLPALHLSLFHRPRRFRPELLGYTLAWACRKPAWWDDPLIGDDEAGRLASAALAAYPEREVHEARIRAGWNLYCGEFRLLLEDIGGRLSRRTTAEDAMAEIVRARLPEAIGYHGRITLQGRSLDRWLVESADDPCPLLAALRESPRVDKACPAGSRLIRAMEFGGPMFGVFGAAEKQACLAWIENPANAATGATPSGKAFAPMSAGPASATPGKPNRAAPRKLYTALLQAESPADCPAAAETFVRRILRRACWLSLLQPAHKRRFPYSPEAFHARIDALHRREVERYRPLSGPPKLSRKFCRWAALQLAPAILVDGAWLAGIATAAEKLGDLGRHLLKTYADELGEGREEWNHPNVYRRLLESLDYRLPTVDSREFAEYSGFLDSAFDIPVLILAMGQLSDKYFPELLGLNLAIELSGLGAGYMRVAEILEYHGMDAAIIRLHLSIDNLASGHAARARDAIVLYLDDARRREGTAAVAALWARIWAGYLSLDAAGLAFAARLALGYFSGRSSQIPTGQPGSTAKA
jgi:hypothetical protein